MLNSNLNSNKASKLVKSVILVSSFGLLSGISSFAWSDSGIRDSGVTLDFALGYGHAVASNITGTGGSAKTSDNIKEHGFAWNVNLGYKFMPYLALELGYFGYDEVKYNFSGTTNVSASSINNTVLALKGIAPLGHGFSLYAKAGPAYVRQEQGAASGAGVVAKTSNKGRVFGRVGGNFNFSQGFYMGVGANYTMKQDPVPATVSLGCNVRLIF